MNAILPLVHVRLQILLLVLYMAACAHAEDWPQFRGVNRDAVSHETGLMDTIPAEGLKILWRKPVGHGWATPVVAGGKVFVEDALLEKPSCKERLQCFDAATGSVLWTHQYDATYGDWIFGPEQMQGPTASPAVEGNRVYMIGGTGQVKCLDTETGAVVWEHDLGKEFKVAELQCRSSPLIDGPLLIVVTGATPGASVAALEKTTGNFVWKTMDDPISNSSPIIINAGGTRQLIVWSGTGISSLNPATGAQYWREDWTSSNNDNIPTPVVEGNALLISGLMFALDPAKPAATIAWPPKEQTGKRLLSNTSTALLRGGHVYSARSGGGFVCLDAATGTEVWRVDSVTEKKSGASIQIIATGDRVFLFTDEGNLILAQISPEGYKELGRAHIIDPTSIFGKFKFAWAPPAIANHCIFARTDAEIVCASLAAGR